MSIIKSKEWVKKKNKSTMIRADLDFVKFLEREYPGVRNPERMRRLMDKIKNGK